MLCEICLEVIFNGHFEDTFVVCSSCELELLGKVNNE